MVKGGGAIAALFFLRDAGDLPLGLLHGGDNLVRSLLIQNFDVLAFEFAELGFEQRRRAGVEQGVDGPVFLGDEGADFLFALDDQAQRHSLHPPGGKAAAHFVPEQRRNFVAHDAIEHAAGLLRVHQIFVYFATGCSNAALMAFCVISLNITR